MESRKSAVAVVWCSYALLFGPALSWCGAGQSEANFKALVRTYDYAQTPGEIVVRGERMAAEIFRRAGIDLVWIDCPTSTNDLEKVAACAANTDLTVKILPEAMASKFGLPLSNLGVTVQRRASFVFYHRVRDLANNAGLSEAAILGSVMAHEFGHLLLGEGAHSDTGIMMADLDAKKFRDAEKGKLLNFSAEQARRMRARFARTTNLSLLAE